MASTALADWGKVEAAKPAVEAVSSQATYNSTSPFFDVWRLYMHAPLWVQVTILVFILALLGVILSDMVERKRNKIRLMQAYENWLTWPTMEEYVKRYPETRTKRGVVCKNCSSGYIRNTSFGGLALQRVVACKACNETMYRLPI